MAAYSGKLLEALEMRKLTKKYGVFAALAIGLVTAATALIFTTCDVVFSESDGSVEGGAQGAKFTLEKVDTDKEYSVEVYNLDEGVEVEDSAALAEAIKNATLVAVGSGRGDESGTATITLTLKATPAAGSYLVKITEAESEKTIYRPVPLDVSGNFAPVELSEPEDASNGTYEVTFDIQGGIDPAPEVQTVPAGKRAIRPEANPEKRGFVFDDWYADSDGIQPYNFDALVTGDTVIYANWLPAEGFKNITAVINYFAALPKNEGATLRNPVELKLDFPYQSAEKWAEKWEELMLELEAAGRYIKLDLSGSDMDPDFDPTPGSAEGKKYIKTLILPKDATSIPDGVKFIDFDNLTEIKGEKIKNIGKSVFQNNISLEKADFPAVTKVGEDLFNGCTALTSVNLPNLPVISTRMFENCSVLKDISFRAVKEIGSFAFSNCDALTVLPGTAFPVATEIADSVFSSCDNLETAEFPALKSIGNNAFNGCTALATLAIKNVSDIGDNVFVSTDMGDLAITVGTTVPTVGSNLFYGLDDEYNRKQVTIKYPDGRYPNKWFDAFDGEGYDEKGSVGDGENNNPAVYVIPSPY